MQAVRYYLTIKRNLVDEFGFKAPLASVHRIPNQSVAKFLIDFLI